MLEFIDETSKLKKNVDKDASIYRTSMAKIRELVLKGDSIYNKMNKILPTTGSIL